MCFCVYEKKYLLFFGQYACVLLVPFESNMNKAIFFIYCVFVVSPVKQGRHIGIMTTSSASSAFGFRSITFEGMHKFHSKFTDR